MSRVVAIFARYPQPGIVKTRLIGRLTAEEAEEVYRRCLDLTLACIDAVSGVRRVLAVTPDDADCSGIVGENVSVVPQGPGDLGQRLRRVVDREFAAGCRHLVVVGSDCPALCPEDVQRAFALLESADVVIGPATDGGYYLLGLRTALPALFESIAWGSSQVAQQTRDHAREAGLRVAELAVRQDLDRYEDIAVLAHEIPDDDARLGSFKRFLKDLLKDGDERG